MTLVLLLAILIAVRILYERRRDRRLPPGPPRLPLIGNLHQAPLELPARTFHEWSRKYGPVISAQFGMNTVIMIADPVIARDLLDKRGQIYSDRPRMVMAGENLTKGMHLLLRRYNDRYRLHQRMDAPALGPRASPTYYPLQDLESRQLLFDLLTSNDFDKIFGRYAASLMYALAYGYRLHTGNEKIMKDAHQVQQNFAYAGRVGTWIVDAIPALNVLPPLLAPWKRTAESFFQMEKAMHLRNLDAGRSASGWNWTKEFTNSPEAKDMDDVELAYNLGIVADAGLDTTTMVMRVFTLAALVAPDFIPKAQSELDRVVGPDRLPVLADRDHLPYIAAVVEETLRWRTIAPTGAPHATTQDDSYGGYLIPKGATVMALFWTMCLDDAQGDSPFHFRPERWLVQRLGNGTSDKTSAEQQPFVNFFGYGRRICAGRHIARNSLFLLIARLLWGFNIRHAVDANGKKKKVDDMAFTSGFVSAPVPFEAIFEARSAQAAAVIEREWKVAEKDVGKLMDGIREEQAARGLSLCA
ncbi:hypothetical protein ASPZODRAFT_70738 [Penicilliopsis zonata CBS 506.65]|uniref:Cytochrome P450 n=1 Tax=Penicilliopsis zonata CBS 506.65 TaxID=1073090 RepID=A0A1L9SCQ1_9EURO|nr:hypothetical protein ASPZODRAFT_70738 [Penicilliopsis zonata CBS 506.65]OJJ44995.1 hypothetical protein ASPZODRAFT_70738 [Penicilliopsis zonata CBS 506.65]